MNVRQMLRLIFLAPPESPSEALRGREDEAEDIMSAYEPEGHTVDLTGCGETVERLPPELGTDPPPCTPRVDDQK